MSKPIVAIIGSGPAGLMAAETLASQGCSVTVFERMASPARKFLMAGHGGLNLTHSENLDQMIARYGAAAPFLAPALQAFPPAKLIAWCEDLGCETFVGSSGRVFPKSMKASPLLRAWLQRLSALSVSILPRHTWQGWDASTNDLVFLKSDGTRLLFKAEATLLALGGASWPRLSGGGDWATITDQAGLPRAPFAPSNCGFIVPWSQIFADKFAGLPLKPVVVSFNARAVQGELMITAKGLEGGVIYALSAALREAITADGFADIQIDLRPGLSLDALTRKLQAPHGSQSLSTYLQKTGGLSKQAIGLWRETSPSPQATAENPATLAASLKSACLRLTATSGLERAISCAGGLKLETLTPSFMLREKPGVFVAGEMLDWEAPTGGFLLQACFSTGVAAAEGISRWLKKAKQDNELYSKDKTC